jgi:hypothetical protein
MSLILGHTSTISSPFPHGLITFNLSLKAIVFRRIFACTAPGDVDLRFSLPHVSKKRMLLKRNLNEPRDYITNVINSCT